MFANVTVGGKTPSTLTKSFLWIVFNFPVEISKKMLHAVPKILKETITHKDIT